MMDATDSTTTSGTATVPAILDEHVLSLGEAAAALPLVAGKRPSVSTMWRWARQGLQNGVRLEYARIGRRIVTSREALVRFAAALADADATSATIAAKTPRADRPRTDAQREAAMDRAESELSARGW